MPSRKADRPSSKSKRRNLLLKRTSSSKKKIASKKVGHLARQRNLRGPNERVHRDRPDLSNIRRDGSRKSPSVDDVLDVRDLRTHRENEKMLADAYRRGLRIRR